MVVQSILFIIGYFAIIPAVTYVINSSKGKNAKVVDTSINPTETMPYPSKLRRWMRFGFKEYSKKHLVIGLYVFSILITPIVGIFSLWYAIPLLFIMPFLYGVILKTLVSKELNEKDTLIVRMLEFKRSKMGLVERKSNLLTYQQEFMILENDPDDGKPSKIRLFLPVNFDPIGADKFLSEFSIQFGRNRPFEIDKLDKDYPGWDTNTGVATIVLEKPLPTKASWEEWYITHPAVQWSFFPLGLGSKGGIPLTNPETGEEIHLIGYDVDGAQKSYCDKNGIPIGADIIASPHSLGAGVTGGGKSVSQNNIINACLMRPKDWTLFGIDMKKVELGKLRQYGVPVATTYEDAAAIATYVQKVMIERFEEMERRGINNWEMMPKEEQGQAIMLMVDEVSELLAPVSGKSDEAKAIAEQQDTIRSALESIARLGRAARVVMTIWGQRPDSTVVSMQIRQNCPTRLCSGNLPQTISQMVFESTEGNRVPGNPKGRMLIKTHSIQPIHFQGFFADSEWIARYLDSKGLPRNVYEGSSTAQQFEEYKEMEAGPEVEPEMTDEELGFFG